MSGHTRHLARDIKVSAIARSMQKPQWTRSARDICVRASVASLIPDRQMTDSWLPPACHCEERSDEAISVAGGAAAYVGHSAGLYSLAARPDRLRQYPGQFVP